MQLQMDVKSTTQEDPRNFSYVIGMETDSKNGHKKDLHFYHEFYNTLEDVENEFIKMVDKVLLNYDVSVLNQIIGGSFVFKYHKTEGGFREVIALGYRMQEHFPRLIKHRDLHQENIKKAKLAAKAAKRQHKKEQQLLKKASRVLKDNGFTEATPGFYVKNIDKEM